MEDKMFIDMLKEICKTNNTISENKEYLAFEDVLIDFASDNGVTLNELDMIELSSSMDVDADGYPYVEKKIEIAKYKCNLTIRAFHHRGWDFYVEDIEDVENIKVVEFLKHIEEEGESFLDGGAYPRLESALIELLDENDVSLKESDIEVLSSDIDIDCDGYPFVVKDMKIPRYGFRVQVSAYHRNDWYFYIDSVKAL